MRCKGWQQEAALRMLENNLHPDVAEKPSELVVYGGIGKAARDQASLRTIRRELQELEADQTLLVQSGKPVGVARTHEWAPRVLIANAHLVPDWANWEEFRRLEELGAEAVSPDDFVERARAAGGGAGASRPRPTWTRGHPRRRPRRPRRGRFRRCRRRSGPARRGCG